MQKLFDILAKPLMSASPNYRERAVVCRGLIKRYGTGDAAVTALAGVNLEVFAGELLMLVGPSGCGKTTLISVIAGILDQDQGYCSVFDHDFQEMSNARKTVKRGELIGFVFQTFNLLPTLTAEENVAIPLLLRGVNWTQANKRARDMLDRVGLSARTRSFPAELSGGQQQRVAIARALIHDPKLVVCDEPTSALDHETGHQILQLLQDVALGPGRSLVIVTHDSRIFQFADRIARMDDGRITAIDKGQKPEAGIVTTGQQQPSVVETLS